MCTAADHMPSACEAGMGCLSDTGWGAQDQQVHRDAQVANTHPREGSHKTSMRLVVPKVSVAGEAAFPPQPGQEQPCLVSVDNASPSSGIQKRRSRD